MTPTDQTGGELYLDASGIELLAARIAKLVADQLPREVPEPTPMAPRLLTAAEVSRWWGVRRAWVYAHAAELGAVRIGDGARPRLRFDPQRVQERLRSSGSSGTTPELAAPGRARVRRSARSRGDSPRLAFRADPEISSLSREKWPGQAPVSPVAAPKTKASVR